LPPDDPIVDDPTLDAPPADPPPAAPPGAPSPDAIRNSPEFKALAAQNRTLARQAGQATRQAEQARTAAEQARQVAEAQEQADLEGEIATILGDEAAVAAFNEIAELTTSDPRAAAKRMAELVALSRVQNAAPGEPTVPSPAPPAGGTVTTPPPPRGVGADAPLGQPPRTEDDHLAIASELDKKYQNVVDRVQDPTTRRRVTMRDRAEGFIGYVGAAVLRAGARPSQK